MHVPTSHRVVRVVNPEPPADARCPQVQNIVRALVLLELLESLPVGEASPDDSERSRPDGFLSLVFWSVAGLTVLCWLGRAQALASIKIPLSLLCIAVAAQSPSLLNNGFWFSWVLGVGILGLRALGACRPQAADCAMPIVEEELAMPPLLPLEDAPASYGHAAVEVPSDGLGPEVYR